MKKRSKSEKLHTDVRLVGLKQIDDILKVDHLQKTNVNEKFNK